MMTHDEQKAALEKMRETAESFYYSAIKIGVHPFIEFAGLMNEYIKVCVDAHNAGIDFSECNRHAGNHLPMRDYQIEYLNEKLDCIFTGRIIAQKTTGET